ncbi:MAG: hypothetical protein Kow009_06130 [Spirochaetales bacterium]
MLPKDLHPLQYTSDPDQMVPILDALESVTNGMENPGLLEQIQEIPRGSPLRPYVELVLALKAYYGNDPEEVGRHLDSIPDESPPGRMIPLLSFLAGLSKDPPERKVDREILKALQQRKSTLEIALEEAEQFLEQNHEESFSDSIAYLIRELYGKLPLASKQLTLWAFEEIQNKGWEGSLLDAHLKMIFGSLEAVRLKALYLLQSGRPGSFQAWSSYLMGYLQTEPRQEEAVEAILLVWLYTGVRDTADPHQVEEAWNLLEKKHPQVRMKYEKLLQHLASPEVEPQVPGFSGSPASSGSSRRSRRKRTIVQLELFPS